MFQGGFSATMARNRKTKDLRTGISNSDRTKLLEFAEQCANYARDELSHAMSSGIAIDRKQDNSVVTEADIKIEKRIRSAIQKEFPQHGVLGEERERVEGTEGFTWIIDPIDGTEEFVHGSPLFGTVIALHYRGLPLIGVIDHAALDLRLSGAFELGLFLNGDKAQTEYRQKQLSDCRIAISKRSNFQRTREDESLFDTATQICPNCRIYNSSYSYTSVISGGVDLLYDVNVKPWDFAAAELLVVEAGGVFFGPRGGSGCSRRSRPRFNYAFPFVWKP